MKVSEEQKRQMIELYKEGYSCNKIGEKLNRGSSTVNYWINKSGIEKRMKSHNIIDMTGEKHGRLTVVKQVSNLKTTTAKWLCLCDCGNYTEVNRPSLVYKLTKSCGCLQRESSFKGYNDLSGQYWSGVKRGAKIRNIDFDITIEYAWNKFIEQNKQCALTGIDIVLIRNYSKNRPLNTASLDRIDNECGYFKWNIHWVHRDINMMKGKHDVKYFIELCKLVAQHNGIQQMIIE